MTRSQFLLAACFCLLVTITFATQFAGAGFGGGGHYSWVSSHHLAIMSRATFINGFVGHTQNLLQANGTLWYQYLDRWPVFLGALVGTLINLTDDMGTRIWVARQVMLTIFALTLPVAWRLLRRLGAASWPALAMVTLAASGYGLLYYRELIGYDAASVLGMLLLLAAIARIKWRTGRKSRRELTLMTMAALGLGAGYASLSVLGLWFSLAAAGVLARRGTGWRAKLRTLSRHAATRMLLLGLVWGALLLSWNLAHDMTRNQVPLTRAGIFDSMQRRGPTGTGTWGRERSAVDEFLLILEDRFGQWYMLPLLISLILVGGYILRQPVARRIPLLLTAGSGLAWTFGMINLTWYHDYTGIFLLGPALVFWLAMLAWLRYHPRLNTVALVLALALFTRASLLVESDNRADFVEAEAWTQEFSRIRQQLGSGGKVVGTTSDFQKVIRGPMNVPYAPGFWLPEQILTNHPERAEYLVTTREYWFQSLAGAQPGVELLRTRTPENRLFHLVDTSEKRHVFLPADIRLSHNFGGRLSLGAWEMLDDVHVQPCQHVWIAGWWMALRPPQDNYRVEIGAVAADGQLRATSHLWLTERRMEPLEDSWFFVPHVLELPCDLSPGTYSLLLLGVQEGSLLLPQIAADGSPGDHWQYLTTLHVG